LEKLSSGYRINRAGDDAAGLAISEKMRAQIRGLGMASKNSQDAISLVQTAEGALSETQSILQRMRELAVQSANDTNVTVDRKQIQKEINQLTTEINRIGNATEFNTMTLLNGNLKKEANAWDVNLADQTITNSYASKVTAGFTADMAAAVGSITIEAGGEFATNVNSASASIQILKGIGENLTVKIAGGTAVSSASTYTDVITLDASGGYTYDNHGVSFTIAASSVASISAGETVKISGLTAGTTGSISTKSTYTSSGDASSVATLGPIKITGNNDNKDVRIIQIDWVTDAATAGGTLTVTMKDSGGTNTLITDKIELYAAGSYTYEEHGVKFEFDFTNMTAGRTLTASYTMTAVETVATAYNDNSLQFQVGANKDQTLALDVGDMRAAALKVSSLTSGSGFNSTKSVTNGTSSTESEYALDVSTASAAASAIEIYNDAITSVSEERAKLGSVQNRLEHTINNLDVTAENLQASESRIRDVDMAKEMMEFTKNNILMQAAQAMLAQANQQPQGVLQLLR
jgi:flagellin